MFEANDVMGEKRVKGVQMGDFSDHAIYETALIV